MSLLSISRRVTAAEEAPLAGTPAVRRARMLRPLPMVALVVLVLLVVACFAAPLLAPAGPNAGDLTGALSGPGSSGHLLGTDDLGRDILTRLLYGGRATLLDAAVVLLVGLAVGVPLGLISGFFGGGWLDRLVTLLVEIGMAIPVFVMVLVVISVFKDSFTVALIALGVIMAPALVRNIRGAVVAVRAELYVDVARVGGVPSWLIVCRHVLRRTLGPILVQATLLACMGLLFTSGLAYLGFGVHPPNPTWGSMVAEGSQIMDRSGWLLTASGGLVGITLLCLGLIGDGIRDATVGSWTQGRRTSETPAVTGAGRVDPSTVLEQPPSRDALLSVRGLTIAYDDVVATGVSFDCAPGEAVGLVGESGCGKTSVSRALVNLLRGNGRIISGSVTFDGRDVLTLDTRELRAYNGGDVAYVSQEPMTALPPAFRVGTMLTDVLRVHRGLEGRAARRRAVELLEMVRLPDPERVLRLYPHELSGGMAQRVAIARALAGEPRLLIADEPTTALDATVQAEILALLDTLRAETGMALLLVSHDWGVIEQVCGRAIVMYAGQVVEQGPLPELLDRPAHPYTKLLLACRPGKETPQDQDLPTIPGVVPDPSAWARSCRFADRCPYVLPSCSAHPVALERIDALHQSRCLRAAHVRNEEKIVVVD